MENFSDLDKLLQGFVDRGLTGCGMQIAQKSKKICEGYFGCDNIENRKPVAGSKQIRLPSGVHVQNPALYNAYDAV